MSIRTRICDSNERQAGKRATEVRIMVDPFPRLPCRVNCEGEIAESEYWCWYRDGQQKSDETLIRKVHDRGKHHGKNRPGGA
jgi:hypothetical protein